MCGFGVVMVILSVNQERLVSNLRYAFSDQTVVIAELMQNARRAGASNVDIEFDAKSKTLTVTDNGSGISNFSSLFALAESGWEDDIQASEHPFGMGFFSTLFSAEEVEVYSFDQFIRFKTKDALAFSSIAINTIESYEPSLKGAKIRLIGLNLPLYEVERAVKKYAKGFPIDVSLNGLLIDRPHATDKMNFSQSAIGLVNIESSLSSSVVLYLQGIPVKSLRASIIENPIVIHLNSDFRGRMPDRSTLLEEQQCLARINETLKELCEHQLNNLKATLDKKEFAEKYWDEANRWGLLDVFNDVPYLPSHLLYVYSGTPILTEYTFDVFMQKRNIGVSKEQVESGEVVLFTNVPEFFGNPYWAAATLAKRLNWVFVPKNKLLLNHWATKYVVDLSKIEVELDCEPLVNTTFSGCYEHTYVTLCDSYTLRYNQHSVTIDDEAVFYNSTTLLIPKFSSGGEALEQVSDYFNDGVFDQTAFDYDTRLLSILVRSELTKIHGGSQEEIFNDVLVSGHVKAFPVLTNTQFLVRLNANLEHETIQIAPEHLERLNQFISSLTTDS